MSVQTADPSSTRSAALLEALLDTAERCSLAPGEIACRQGDDSDRAFVVVSGRLDSIIEGHGGDVVIARHGPRSLVGEITALIGGHRTATLRAGEPTDLAVIARTSLHDVFDAYPEAAADVLRSARERTDRSRVAALLSHELQAPDGEAVVAIAERVTWTSLAAGDTLFERGDAADAAYLVTSGRLGIVDLDTPGTIEVGRGGIVGEFGLLDDRSRSATVVALRDSTLARLAADDFASISVDHTSLAMGLVRRILDRSGADHSSASIGRTFAVAWTADVGHERRDAVVDAMRVALDACGPTVVADADFVDTSLLQPGIANVEQGSFGEVRIAELLHQLESDHDHVVLRTGGVDEDVMWTHRSLHASDQVIVVCSPEPDADERRRIEDLLASIPTRIPTWLAIVHPTTTIAPGAARLLADRFDVAEIHHLRLDNHTDAARLGRLAAGRGVGLVLSGGGARGNAHIGVYRSLVEHGVPVDRVVGASMGSILAGVIAQGLTPDDVLTRIADNANDLLDYTVPLVSLIKGERIVRVLDDQFGTSDIDDLPIPFSCVSTDLTDAEVVVHRSGPIATMIRTSISIPGVLPPVAHGSHLLADGGILENLPVGVMSSDPSIATIIASDVAPPVGPSAKGDHGLSVSGWSVLRDRIVPARLRRRDAGAGYPGVANTLMRSLLIGSSRSRDAHLASGSVDLYLELDLRGIALLDFSQVRAAAERGYESSHGRIGEWISESGRRW